MSDLKYRVTRTIQAPGNDPVDVVWQRSGNALSAAYVVTQILHDEAVRLNDARESLHPASRFKTLKVTIELIEPEVAPWKEGEQS